MSFKKTIIFLALLCIIASCSEKRAIRVACVGDSITEGFGIEWQSENAYPALLDSILGEGFDVMNFGRSATTMMRSGDFPYWSAKEFTNTLQYHPDIIVIKLGTNDAKLYQWNQQKYIESYQQMIDTFMTLKPVPKIFLCSPVPVIYTRWEITDSVITNGVIPAVEQLSHKNNLDIIDLNSTLSNKDGMFSDGIHPTREGALLMAQEIARCIKK